MGTSKTYEGNLKIAMFTNSDTESVDYTNREFLNYNEDWNLLMPVVYECFDLSSDDTQSKEITNLQEGLLNCDIEAVFEAVVKFIDKFGNVTLSYKGPELDWGIEDVLREAAGLGVPLTVKEASEVLRNTFKDNETLMEYINKMVADEVAYFKAEKDETEA